MAAEPGPQKGVDPLRLFVPTPCTSAASSARGAPSSARGGSGSARAKLAYLLDPPASSPRPSPRPPTPPSPTPSSSSCCFVRDGSAARAEPAACVASVWESLRPSPRPASAEAKPAAKARASSTPTSASRAKPAADEPARSLWDLQAWGLQSLGGPSGLWGSLGTRKPAESSEPPGGGQEKDPAPGADVSAEGSAEELRRLREAEGRLTEQLRELTEQLREAEGRAAGWQEHAEELSGLLKENDLEALLPPPPSEPAASVGPQPLPAVLGIRTARCGCCGADRATGDRVFADLGKLYCWDCWGKWERCGWWRPSIRVSTIPPRVRVPGGVPHWVAEDCFVVPAFACAHDDFSLMEALKSELPPGRDFSDWHGGRHLGCQFEGEAARHRGEGEPEALKATVARLEAAFGIRASASRLNLYRSEQDYKPLHCDRGRDQAGTPQATVGLSLGGTRELTMMHIKTGVTATFPQRNGDVFFFTPELNVTFMHGVPKVGFGSPSEVEGSGERLSLILWGSKAESRAGAA